MIVHGTGPTAGGGTGGAAASATLVGRMPSSSRRRPRSAILVAVAVVAGTAVVAAPASADPAPGRPGPEAQAPPSPTVPTDQLGEDRIHPDLAGIVVDSPAYREAISRLRATQAALDDARARIAASDAQLASLRTAEAALVAEIDLAAKRRAKSEARLEALRAEVRDLAVATYVRGGVGTAVDAGLDLSGSTDDMEAEVIVDALGTQQFAELELNSAVVAETTGTIDRQQPVLDAVRAQISDTERALGRARDDEAAAGARLGPDQEGVAEARVLSGVVGLDFPLVVLDAYYRAAAQFGVENPACGLRWEALAGIGRTESAHGSYLGASVDAAGVVTPPIRGIPLDGTRGTAVVGDTDGGALDGDPGIDRAVGPMQFLPGSWRALGRDGDGDDRADPDNMYDAALAAAALLCRQGPGLDTEEGLRRAYFTYNRSQEYVQIVLDRTLGYDAYGL